MPRFQLTLLVVLSFSLGLGSACIKRLTIPERGAEEPAAAPRDPGFDPFKGARLYVDPDSRARRQAEAWRATRSADAALLFKIASQPQADWFGDWNSDIKSAVEARVKTIDSAGAVAVFVVYNIPQRDCGQYSAGGANNPDHYRRWIRDVARGVGSRRAVVILEPDALGLLDKCLSPADQKERLFLLGDAVRVLRSNSETAVYIDAGNANWQPALEMARRLAGAGVREADGFALNVSNYIATTDTIVYGKAISSRLGGARFVIDTSRNGNGPTTDLQWCNPDGRALGEPPTMKTGEPLVAAYLWIKRPGESDGTCNGGPRAGEWWPEQAVGLAQRAKF